jgi:predicted RNA-binding protein YlqC (UPF0109 family)
MTIEYQSSDGDNEGIVLEESELLLEVIRSIVSKPEKVTVEATKAHRTTILTITVDPTDRGQIIGKDHMTLMAIKHIFSKAAFLENRKVIIQVEGLQESRPRFDQRYPSREDFRRNNDREFRPRRFPRRPFTSSY